jgi:protein gp37
MPTKIEWCDETFNPWWGCERVSPGCAHCYAATFSRRLGMDHLWPRRPSVQNGQEHGFRFFGDEHWAEPLKWARTLPAKLGRRPRVFCASMADVFEERDELLEPRRRLFDLIAETPELDWLILTKRPEFARDLFAAWDRADTEFNGAEFKMWPLLNVWLGVSIETARQTYRADVLREIPAAVRFISAEPLLGSLYDGRRDDEEGSAQAEAVHPSAAEAHPGDSELRSLDRAGSPSVPSPGRAAGLARRASGRAPLDLTGIDWLIIGGESGPGARKFHLEHARELTWAAMHESAGRTAVFVKQLGSKPVFDDDLTIGVYKEKPLRLSDGKGGDMDEWPLDLRVREWPTSSSQLVRMDS